MAKIWEALKEDYGLGDFPAVNEGMIEVTLASAQA